MRKMLAEGLLDMRRLSEMDRPQMIAVLKPLVTDYAAWIEEQAARIGKDVVEYDTPARQALDRCRDVLKRLHEGIAVLEKDDKALLAFRFANQAMASQRVRSIYALRCRRGENPDLA